MKTLQHFALAAVVVAGLLLPAAMTRPQPVSAGSLCGYVVGLITAGLAGSSCDAFSVADTSCTLGNVNVGTLVDPNVSATANGNQNSYTYAVNCDTGSVHVQATYDFPTGKAVESLRSEAFTLSAVWNCPHDPWIAPSPQPCTLTGASGSTANGGTAYDIEGIDLSQKDGVPFSARILDDNARLVLFSAQLKYTTDQAAIVAAQKEAAARAAYLATQVTPTTSCANCSAAGSTLSPALAPTAATYHAPSIVAGWPQLSLYTQGEAVTSLQYLLLQNGATLPVDGKFGSSTDAAVRAFQKAQAIIADGIGTVGPQTWQALIVTVQQGSQGAAVKAVQSQLKSRNVAITVDGDFGSQTDAVVRTYQKAHPGLTVDGQVGPQTWKPLLAGN